MNKLASSLLLIGTLFLGSCTSYTFFPETIQEYPSSRFPALNQSIVLVNNAVEQPSNRGSYFILADGSEQSFLCRHDSLTSYLINALGGRFLGNGSFSDVLLYNLPLRKDSLYRSAPPIPLEHLSQIEEESGAQWILSLERLNYVTLITENKLPDFNVATAKLSIEVAPLWRLYQAGATQSCGSFYFSDTLHWDATQMNFQLAIKELPPLNACLTEALEVMVDKMERSWLPLVREDQRFYVIHSNPAMRQAQYDLINGNPEDAVKMWTYTYKKVKNKRVRQYAAFNLAVFSETQRQFEDALNWVDKAIQANPMQDQVGEWTLTDYRKELEKRQNTQKRSSEFIN